MGGRWLRAAILAAGPACVSEGSPVHPGPADAPAVDEDNRRWTAPSAAPQALPRSLERAPEPPAPGDELFGADVIHRFDLELAPGAREALASDPETDVEATFRHGDRALTVGVHLKGSFSFRPMSGKAAFKIDFGEFVPGQRLYGLRRLTLNNMVQDRSMIREHVAYRVYAWLGVPAPRHGYAEVWVDGEPYGLYGIVETPDGDWAERVFPRDAEGPIYEGGYGVDLEAGDAEDFVLQRQGDLAEPWSDIAALIEALDATPPEGFPELFEARFDADAVLRMWAMDLVSGHRDGYVSRKNNFLLYHGLRSDRWWMVPWGQDQALRDGLDVTGSYSGSLARACDDAAPCRERLRRTLGTVANLWEVWDVYGYAEATGAAIAEACERDPRREQPCGYDGVLEVIAERPAAVRAMLAEVEE